MWTPTSLLQLRFKSYIPNAQKTTQALEAERNQSEPELCYKITK